METDRLSAQQEIGYNHDRSMGQKSGPGTTSPRSLTRNESETLLKSRLSSRLSVTSSGMVRLQCVRGMLRGERWAVNPGKAEEMILAGFWVPIDQTPSAEGGRT